jgi:hypothetical protein
MPTTFRSRSVNRATVPTLDGSYRCGAVLVGQQAASVTMMRRPSGTVLNVRRALVLLVAIAALATGQVAHADSTRQALVIGIGAYRHVAALTNPPRDAKAIAASLRERGFDVAEAIDADYTQLKNALRDFGERAAKADAAVVYYAGHGMQVDHENYLVPADAQFERERDLLYEALKLGLVLSEVGRAKKVGLVILDACRNNPFYDKAGTAFAARGTSTPRGLAKVDNVPPNTAVAMATRGDAIAEDGGGSHSPYTAAILAHLEVPGLELGLFFRSVRDTVLKATNNRQEPYLASSLGAEPFYFYPPRPTPPEVSLEAIKRATEGNTQIQTLVEEYVQTLISDRLAKEGHRVIELDHEAPAPSPPSPAQPVIDPPPKAAEKPPAPPPAVAVAPLASRVITEVKPNVKPADNKRKPAQDFLCSNIIERSQLGEPISEAERIYLQKCR